MLQKYIRKIQKIFIGKPSSRTCQLPVTSYSLREQNGIAALLAVIVIGAVALLFVKNVALLSIRELDSGFISQRGTSALTMADGCIEESLRRLRLDTSYTGGFQTLTDSSCIITVTEGGLTRTIVTTASTTDAFYAKVEATVTLSGDTPPTIMLNSWNERE